MLIGKSWGNTKAEIATPLFEAHRINVDPEHCSSWHRHERKWNAFVVIKGALIIEVEKAGCGRTSTVLRAGDITAVRPGERHRFVTGLSPTEAFEFYYPDVLGEDIIRMNCGGAVEREAGEP